MADCSTTRIIAYVSGELAPAARSAFEAHLNDCPSCRALLREHRALVARLGDWTLPSRDTDLTARVLDRLDTPPADHGRRISLYPSLRIAAAVVLGVGLGHVGGRLVPPHTAEQPRDHSAVAADSPNVDLLSEPDVVGLWAAYVELEAEEGEGAS